MTDQEIIDSLDMLADYDPNDRDFWDGEQYRNDTDLMRAHYAGLAKGKRGYSFCEVCGRSTRRVLDGEAYCDHCERYQ